VPELEHGRSFDRFRVMLYEAAAMGVNMSVPYGAWMGAMIEDAMWAPHDETVEIQDFIADHEHLFSSESENSVAVVYSVESNFLPLTFAGALQARIDPVTKRRGELSTPIAFFRAAEELEAAGQPIDTIVFHDGRLREDTASTSALERYARVILPDCTALTGRQLDAVLGYLDGGGRVTVTGALGPTGSPGVERILAHASTTIADGASPIEPPQVRYSAAAEVAANLAKVADGAALHLINYGYDDELDATQVRHDVTVELDLAGPLKIKKVIVHRPGAQPSTLPVRATASGISFTIPVLGPYAIIEIARE